MNLFSPPSKELFFTQKDAADPRLGDLAKLAPEGPGVAILGYPDDEGVRLNGGRAGAKEGPDAIRNWLYRTTPHLSRKTRSFFDLGNLKFSSDLKQRHDDVAAEVHDLLGKGHRVLSLGGGNDYAYADGMGFLKTFQGEAGLILNIDAHFDVRDLKKGLTSGTPFYRLLESDYKFDFFEIGIQSQCNSKLHEHYVRQKGGQIISMEDILLSGESFKDFTFKKLNSSLKKKPKVFLAIDMDAFSYPFAAGTSAAWPLGLLPHDFYPFLIELMAKADVTVLGLYETAPGLESGVGTAKLAAQWAHTFLHEPT